METEGLKTPDSYLRGYLEREREGQATGAVQPCSGAQETSRPVSPQDLGA